jgi:ABC-type polysaccharide/polyol phosphate transport system ATPase subunit
MPGHSIELQGVGKRYRLGHSATGYATLRESIMSALKRPREAADRELWALRDVDLAVPEGQALGVVGPNGAGKTTLLRILARISEPTTGVSRTRGRVGALLEVGTGFHPELTGRENIFLNGAILGMRRGEIQGRFDAIVSFAGVERFLDTPLKRYSSGMSLRLAFSVAAHLEPEIMLVDEVLAVGDLDFQRRCVGKLSELEHHGRTVVFISHDLGAIGRLCSRAIWLSGGTVRADGATHDVLDRYLKAGLAAGGMVALPDTSGADAILRSVALLDENGTAIETLRRDRPFSLRARFALQRARPDVDIAVYVTATDGRRVIDECWSDSGHHEPLASEANEYEVTVRVPPILRPGEYLVGVWLGTQLETFLDRDVFRFTVLPHPNDRREAIERPRLVQPGVAWTRSVVGSSTSTRG